MYVFDHPVTSLDNIMYHYKFIFMKACGILIINWAVKLI